MQHHVSVSIGLINNIHILGNEKKRKIWKKKKNAENKIRKLGNSGFDFVVLIDQSGKSTRTKKSANKK